MSSRGEEANDRRNQLLITCNGICNKYLRSIVSNLTGSRGNQRQANSSNALQAELKLWAELKKFKDTNDVNIISYLNGFYFSLLEQILLNWKPNNDHRDDVYFQRSVSTDSLSLDLNKVAAKENDAEDATVRNVRTLVYNIYIRMGDLNPYLRNEVLARTYYNQAREINPLRGHAFNQLALIAGGNHLLQVYCYIRACSSVEDPVNIAETNLKAAVAKYSNSDDVIRVLFASNDAGIQLDRSLVNNWLFVTVVASYANTLSHIARPLLRSTILWLTKQQTSLDPFSSSTFDNNLESDNESLLPAMDVFLDVCLQDLKHARQLTFTVRDLSKEFNDLKTEVTSLLCQSDNFAINSDKKALRHDYVLLGYKPLFEVHQNLKFESSSGQYQDRKASAESADGASQFIFLIKKLSDKVDKLVAAMAAKPQQASASGNATQLPSLRPPMVPSPGPTAGRKAKPRNMALTSILGSEIN